MMNNNLNNSQQNTTDVTVNNTYNNTQTPLSQQSLNNNYNNGLKNQSNEKPKINKIIMPIILVAVVMILAGGVFTFTKKSKNTVVTKDKIYTSAFFLTNKEGKYALFNDDGEQLSEFIFNEAGEFFNGTARVRKDDAYGIIDSNGKMTVDFGKYKRIISSSGLYEVSTEDYHSFLINGTGKVLYDLEDKDVINFSDGYYSILKDTKNKTYSLLNDQGKILKSFPISEKIENDPSTNENEGYISVFYNNKNYIINEQTGKEIASFDDTQHYCVNEVLDDGKMITLNSCVEWYKDQDKIYYKLISNNKLYDLNNKCDNVYYENDNITCSKGEKRYLLDKNANVGIDISDIVYIDNDNYIKEKKESTRSVDFYKNGKVIKNVPCRVISTNSYINDKIYVLETYKNSACGTDYFSYEYYNSDGEKLFNTSFNSATVFDKNHLAIVSKEEGNYYLMDTTGKKVTNDYNYISKESDTKYYEVVKDGLSGLLDSKGQVVLDCNYKSVLVENKDAKNLVQLTTNDSKYAIYNLTTKKEVIRVDEPPSTTSHYISVENDGEKQYYTLDGKMFYSRK